MSKLDVLNELAIAAHRAVKDGRAADADKAIDDLWRAATGGDADTLARAVAIGPDALRKRASDVLAKVDAARMSLDAISLPKLKADVASIAARLTKLENESEAEPRRIPARWFPRLTHLAPLQLQ